jgi:hypothetical protein
MINIAFADAEERIHFFDGMLLLVDGRDDALAMS